MEYDSVSDSIRRALKGEFSDGKQKVKYDAQAFLQQFEDLPHWVVTTRAHNEVRYEGVVRMHHRIRAMHQWQHHSPYAAENQDVEVGKCYRFVSRLLT